MGFRLVTKILLQYVVPSCLLGCGPNDGRKRKRKRSGPSNVFLLARCDWRSDDDVRTESEVLSESRPFWVISVLLKMKIEFIYFHLSDRDIKLLAVVELHLVFARTVKGIFVFSRIFLFSGLYYQTLEWPVDAISNFIASRKKVLNVFGRPALQA